MNLASGMGPRPSITECGASLPEEKQDVLPWET